ncbi:hypothetical protein LCGC14_0639560 [marine sediment metagenome]|uniref:Leucine-rich repeat domain-containing protein n=1 Tax=marine sediment metagenome TaxID=412755 RepID=A0A0F9TL63_9ZZZZ|nr:leucine-rich repeat domain-containing protein [bacterium]
MTRSGVGILDDNEEADIAGFMLEACGISSTDFLMNERLLTRENFEKNFKFLVKMAENRGYRRSSYFVLGYFILLTGTGISEKMRQKILNAAKWEHEEGYWHDKGFALKRKIYLEEFREKIRIHKAGTKLHPAIFKYDWMDFLASKVLIGVKQFQNFNESREFYDIEHVNLDGCNLKSIPEEIYDLRNLKTLSLEFNQISEIDKETSNLVSLKHFYLDYNQLESLPESIGNLLSLKGLSVVHNNVERLPISIKKLKNLKYIYVRGTGINRVPIFLKNSRFDTLSETIYL